MRQQSNFFHNVFSFIMFKAGNGMLDRHLTSESGIIIAHDICSIDIILFKSKFTQLNVLII